MRAGLSEQAIACALFFLHEYGPWALIAGASESISSARLSPTRSHVARREDKLRATAAAKARAKAERSEK